MLVMDPVDGENCSFPGSSRVTGAPHTAHSPIGGSPLFCDCSWGIVAPVVLAESVAQACFDFRSGSSSRRHCEVAEDRWTCDGGRRTRSVRAPADTVPAGSDSVAAVPP